jgi:hypothetical protein
VPKGYHNCYGNEVQNIVVFRTPSLEWGKEVLVVLWVKTDIGELYQNTLLEGKFVEV